MQGNCCDKIGIIKMQIVSICHKFHKKVEFRNYEFRLFWRFLRPPCCFDSLFLIPCTVSKNVTFRVYYIMQNEATLQEVHYCRSV